MKKILLLSSILLLSVTWALAQYGSQSSTSQSSTSSESSNSGMSKTTLQGCLSGSNGNYTLTDSSGATYQLTGDTAKLEKHIGHTIQVTGTPQTSSASNTTSGNPSGSMSGSAEAQQTFDVTSFKHVSGKCNTSGGMMSH